MIPHRKTRERRVPKISARWKPKVIDWEAFLSANLIDIIAMANPSMSVVKWAVSSMIAILFARRPPVN